MQAWGEGVFCAVDYSTAPLVAPVIQRRSSPSAPHHRLSTPDPQKLDVERFFCLGGIQVPASPFGGSRKPLRSFTGYVAQALPFVLLRRSGYTDFRQDIQATWGGTRHPLKKAT
jgi:hypothetical protein